MEMARRLDRIPTLPPKEALILQLLAREREMYGLELVAASRRRLKRGTVYVTLGRMEKKGYVTSRLEDAPPSAGGLPRRIYEATAFGKRVLSAWDQMAARLIPEFSR
jgi:PadR family transcriptional regulator PadR